MEVVSLGHHSFGLSCDLSPYGKPCSSRESLSFFFSLFFMYPSHAEGTFCFFCLLSLAPFFFRVLFLLVVVATAFL